MATLRNEHDELTGKPCIHISEDATGSVVQVHDDGVLFCLTAVEIVQLGPLALPMPAEVHLTRGQVHELIAYFKAVL